jgi:CTP synthase (UTP-ammonia lyase)
MDVARIAIVGDFDRRKHSHWATDAALFHAGARLRITVEPHWIGTPELADADKVCLLKDFDGVWGAPGSPYASMPGILNAISYARERNVAYLGTCAGFQYALIELSRNVLGVDDADSAENDAKGDENIVIKPIYCVAPGAAPGTPRLAGPGVARPTPGTLLEAICGSGDLNEEYFCSLEANADFVPRWEAAGLVVAARGHDGEMRAFELSQRRFFVAALFQPQLSSSYERPHPLIEGFLRACTGQEPRAKRA